MMAGTLRLAPDLAPAALTGVPRVPAKPTIVLDWPLDDIRGGVPPEAATAFAAAVLQVGHAAFLAGHAGGKLKGHLHIKAADGTPMANAMLSMLHVLGLDEMKSFGDSTGAMDLNSAGAATTTVSIAD